MSFVQDWINQLESGPWIRRLKIILSVLALVALVGGYNWFCYRNMDSQEAMDGAQVARNISEGKGFTTLFIRPISVRLVREHNQKQFGKESPGGEADPAHVKETAHPDLANPPVYPCLLAGWMKVYPLLFKAAEAVREVLPGFLGGKLPHIDDKLDNRLWAKNGRFWWHPHDFMIALFNEALLFVLIWQTFLVARQLFDSTVAWISAFTLLGCELLWRFSVSGLSTIFLSLIFIFLVRCLVGFGQEARSEQSAPNRLLLLSAVAGLLVGIGMLTRYSFGWMLIPVLVYIGFLGGGRRWIFQCVAVLVVFLAVISPWTYRNFKVSGTPFGTAGYALIVGENSHFMERSMEPFSGGNYIKSAIRKMTVNSRRILLDELPKLAGGWITPFFLVGLLLPLRSPAIRHLRYFVIGSLVTLIIVQALGRTHLSEASVNINSENLLVIFVPLLLVYGVSLFIILLDQIDLPFSRARYVVMGIFVAVVSLPMIYAFAPPHSIPLAYPPYAPQPIQQSAEWMRESELMMSDVPWAVAWYGNRQCIWLSLDAQEAFYAVNDYLKPVRALYLTEETTDASFLSSMVGSGKGGWGLFYIEILLARQMPTLFPLRHSPKSRIFPSAQLFLTDGERWEATAETESKDTGER